MAKKKKRKQCNEELSTQKVDEHVKEVIRHPDHLPHLSRLLYCLSVLSVFFYGFVTSRFTQRERQGKRPILDAFPPSLPPFFHLSLLFLLLSHPALQNILYVYLLSLQSPSLPPTFPSLLLSFPL